MDAGNPLHPSSLTVKGGVSRQNPELAIMASFCSWFALGISWLCFESGSLYVGSGDLNSGPHACSANALISASSWSDEPSQDGPRTPPQHLPQPVAGTRDTF